MNLQEAYSILELSSEASPEEAKKKYRELTKKYHPDVNKEENAEDKFKKINEAYQCVINGKGSDRENSQPNYNPFQGIPNPFGGNTIRPAENITLNTTISFKESVLGCRRDLHFTRNGKCTFCNGQGMIQNHNGCDNCGGKGQVVAKQGNMIFTRTCEKCMGRQSTHPCTTCSTKGSVNTQISVNVNIPGGVIDNNILRLNGFGNYMGSFMNMDQYSEAHLHIKVIPEEGLVLDGTDVVSFIEISLLEALRGVSKSVKTIIGDKDIFIPGLSKNKDEIKIPNLGVNSMGSQRVIIKVIYPEDISYLINALEDHESNDSDTVIVNETEAANDPDISNNIDLDRE